jgi:hypothetical protein
VDTRQQLIERLEKLRQRLHGKTLTIPGEGCKAVDFHLAGLFLKQHMDTILEALRRMD